MNSKLTEKDNKTDYEDEIANEFAQALESILNGEKPNVDNLTEGQKHIINAINSQGAEGTSREEILQEYVTLQN